MAIWTIASSAKFMPLQNEAGIQTMFCGHLHKYIRKDARGRRRFPVIVNANNTVVMARTAPEGIKVEVRNEQGGLVDSLVIRPVNESSRE